MGGATASVEDFKDLVSGSMWKIALFVLLFSYLVLFVLLRSVLLPLKAVVMNLLSVGAAYGILVAIFQYGWIDGFLGFQSLGYINTITPPFLLAIVFGLSMDYEVFLLTRIRERYEATGDNKLAVAQGLRASAATISSAALIMVAVFAVFAGTGVPSIKEIGLGLAVAIALDATLVRLVLVPATMELMGRVELVAAQAVGAGAAADELRRVGRLTLPRWRQGTPAVLCVAGPHAIPVTTAVRLADDRLAFALGRRRETLERLRADPQVALCLLGTELAFTAYGAATVVREPLEAAPVVGVELRVESRAGPPGRRAHRDARRRSLAVARRPGGGRGPDDRGRAGHVCDAVARRHVRTARQRGSHRRHRHPRAAGARGGVERVGDQAAAALPPLAGRALRGDRGRPDRRDRRRAADPARRRHARRAARDGPQHVVRRRGAHSRPVGGACPRCGRRSSSPRSTPPGATASPPREGS